MRHVLTICAVAAFALAVSVPADAATWNVPEDFPTIQTAIDADSVLDGDKILVGAGNRPGAYVTKAVEIKGEDGAVITSGPVHGSGMIQGFRMLAGGGGATITHLGFEVHFPIMNGAGVDDVTVDHCIMTSPVQGVSNWHGSGWTITHNVINGLRTRCGGGIGIFTGCWNGAKANNNLVAHNKITGEVFVPEDDCGGYSTPGIALMSDRRWGAGGTLYGNRIIKNKTSLSITVPSGANPMEAVGIELTDMGLEREQPERGADLENNKVGFNDVRGVIGVPIALNPEDVESDNAISRNLGDDANNRGHGLHPKALLK